MSEEQKEKISKARKNLHLTLSDEHKQKLIAANKGRKKTLEEIAAISKRSKARSKEQAEMMRKKLKGNTYTAKKVICLNTLKEYNSAAEAARELNLDRSGITKNCRNVAKSCGKDKDGNKLIWMFLDEYKALNATRRG